MGERTANDYWRSIREMAEDVLDECGIDDNEWHDFITESVDGSDWLIYYCHHETILNATDNEPDNREVAAMADHEGDWRAFRSTAAYLAMDADVWQECRKLAEEREEATEEEESKT